MCILCDRGKPQLPSTSRRDFLKGTAATVIVAGKIRKWNGQLLDVDLDPLRTQLAATRDFLYSATGVPQNPFPAK